jgi:hypothetical protein
MLDDLKRGSLVVAAAAGQLCMISPDPPPEEGGRRGNREGSPLSLGREPASTGEDCPATRQTITEPWICIIFLFHLLHPMALIVAYDLMKRRMLLFSSVGSFVNNC